MVLVVWFILVLGVVAWKGYSWGRKCFLPEMLELGVELWVVFVVVRNCLGLGRGILRACIINTIILTPKGEN